MAPGHGHTVTVTDDFKVIKYQIVISSIQTVKSTSSVAEPQLLAQGEGVGIKQNLWEGSNRNLLLVKMKEKNLLKIQPLPVTVTLTVTKSAYKIKVTT
jgi:hypothetical protein